MRAALAARISSRAFRQAEQVIRVFAVSFRLQIFIAEATNCDNYTDRIPNAIFAEASLSFLGLGVPPPAPSWGSMIQDGMSYYRAAPWVAFFPGIAIALTVLSINLLATGLREVMDPTRRGR